MFGVTVVTANDTGTESEELYGQFVDIQESLLSDLGLHGQVS